MIEHQEGMTGDDLEREMFILRKLIEKEKAKRISDTPAEQDNKAVADAADFYICTLSNRVMVYKVLPESDLSPADGTVAYAIVLLRTALLHMSGKRDSFS